MQVVIAGFNATGIILGGLLSLKGNKVSFFPEKETSVSIPHLRLIMPDRWLGVSNLKFDGNGRADFIFVCPGKTASWSSIPEILGSLEKIKKAGTTILVAQHPGIIPPAEQDNSAVCFFLPLLKSAMLQADQVEIFTRKPVILFEKNKPVKKFLASLKQYHISIKFVDSLVPYYNACFITSLLHLPVALCNTTLQNFLSYPEGRKMAEHLLLEGLKIFEQCDKKVAALPVMDPCKLLARIQKKPQSFHLYHYLPHREINPVLESLLLKNREAVLTNIIFQQMASQVGIEIFWNEKMINLYEKAYNSPFYKSPIELLKVIE